MANDSSRTMDCRLAHQTMMPKNTNATRIRFKEIKWPTNVTEDFCRSLTIALAACVASSYQSPWPTTMIQGWQEGRNVGINDHSKWLSQPSLLFCLQSEWCYSRNIQFPSPSNTQFSESDGIWKGRREMKRASRKIGSIQYFLSVNGKVKHTILFLHSFKMMSLIWTAAAAAAAAAAETFIDSNIRANPKNRDETNVDDRFVHSGTDKDGIFVFCPNLWVLLLDQIQVHNTTVVRSRLFVLRKKKIKNEETKHLQWR